MAITEADNIGRTLVQRVLADIWQLKLVNDRARDAQNYKKPAIGFYEAALDKLEAAAADLQALQDHYSEYSSELDPGYYQNEISSLSKQIDAYRAGLSVPQLTIEEEASEEISGTVDEVDDGDTIFVAGKEIRLAGINSAEKGTPRGQDAKLALEGKVAGKRVVVKIDEYQGIELYGRVLGVVFLDGENINEWMVANCHAEVDTKFGRHKYVDPDNLKRLGEKCSATYPGFGVVKVYSSKTHSKIYLDGVDTGKITPAEINVPIGVHEIMVVTLGMSPARQEIEVNPGKVEVLLQQITMPAATGIIEVRSVPTDAEFTLDSVPMGSTPAMVETSSDAPHTITLYKDGYTPEAMTVVAPMGRMIVVTGTMERG